MEPKPYMLLYANSTMQTPQFEDIEAAKAAAIVISKGRSTDVLIVKMVGVVKTTPVFTSYEETPQNDS